LYDCNIYFVLYFSLKFLIGLIDYLLMDTQHYTLTAMELSGHKLCILKLCAVIRLG